jgi:hypothetical protein
VSGRSRTIALQAVGVGIIVVIVYIAFLRPTDPSELSGIDAPGGEEQPLARAPQPDAKRKRGGDDERRDRPRRPSRGASRSDGPATDVPPDGGGALDGGAPPDDQYGDAVARLLARVGDPALARELGVRP